MPHAKIPDYSSNTFIDCWIEPRTYAELMDLTFGPFREDGTPLDHGEPKIDMGATPGSSEEIHEPDGAQRGVLQT